MPKFPSAGAGAGAGRTGRTAIQKYIYETYGDYKNCCIDCKFRDSETIVTHYETKMQTNKTNTAKRSFNTIIGRGGVRRKATYRNCFTFSILLGCAKSFRQWPKRLVSFEKSVFFYYLCHEQ